MKYEIDIALNKFIILEPIEEFKIIQANEVATLFKVKSLPFNTDYFSFTSSSVHATKGDLVIVEKGSVKKTVMGGEDVWYVYATDVVAKVKKAE